MQPDEPTHGEVQSSINVTPLVDVVLVLLIIFMVMVPQLATGPDVDLPETDRPPEKAEKGRQIVVTLERDGTFWVDSDPVTIEQLAPSLRAAADERSDWKVVLKGDARLTYGDVKQAMLAIERAGFKDVSLIADRLGRSPGEG